jgi:two-component system cell cycle sensor histidine kinase/response regulator CckA
MASSTFDKQLHLHGTEPHRATRFLRRSSWAVLAGLGCMAVAMWIARYARAHGHPTLLSDMRLVFQIAFLGTIVLLALLLRWLSSHAGELTVLTRRLKAAQSAAHLGYWEIDLATGARFWSLEMYQLWGIAPGTDVLDTEAIVAPIHPEDRERYRAAIARTRAGEPHFEQVRIELPNGETRVLETKGHMVTAEDGTRMLVGTAQDVTTRVQLEAQLRQSQKMEAVGQLAGGVAHDFNNILTVIEGYGNLLAGSPTLANADREAVAEILEGAHRAAALTRQLLSFSRRQVVQPRVLDLNQAIAEIEKMLRRLIGENIEFITKLESGLAPVLADPGQIEQVLINLAVNARDAMPRGGVLSVETANDGARVTLSVTDTGTGIEPEVLKRMFEPFFTTKGSGKGTGLGLATVQGIVAQMGGECHVRTEMGRGTTFRIDLPAHAGKCESEPAFEGETGQHAGATGTILVVEDDESLRTMATAILRRAGYTVREASNGIEALRSSATLALDLVLTDMVMPGVGGLELTRAMQRLRPGVPTIIMSGYTTDNETLSALSSVEDLGIRFLEKPFTPEMLLRTVAESMEWGEQRVGVV